MWNEENLVRVSQLEKTTKVSRVTREHETIELAFRTHSWNEDSVPVLMVTGFTRVKEDWHRMPELLSERGKRTVISMDNRGMGESDILDGAGKSIRGRSVRMSIEDMSDDVLCVAEFVLSQHRRAKQVDLVGFSMGGFVTLTLLRSHPTMVRRTILLGTASAGGKKTPHIERAHSKIFISRQQQVIQAALKYRASKKECDKRTLFERTVELNALMIADSAPRWFVESMVRVSLDNKQGVRPATVIIGQLNAIRAWELRESELRGMQNGRDVLIIHGEQDRILHWRNGLWIHSRLAHSCFVTLPDEGHATFLSTDGLSATVSHCLAHLNRDERVTSKL